MAKSLNELAASEHVADLHRAASGREAGGAGLWRRRRRISWWPLTRDRRDSGAGEGREEDMSYLPPNSGGIPEVGEREHIQRALANMPRDYAVALVLSAAQGVPYQEIGEILGISPNAAATRISRAKRLFMEVYQRFNDEGAGKQE